MDAPRWRNEPPIVEGRVPPHDLDAEAAVLSAVMLDPLALDKVLEFLKPEHFYSRGAPPHLRGGVELERAGQAGRRRAGGDLAARPRAPRAGRRHGLPDRGPQRRARGRERRRVRPDDPREVARPAAHRSPASASSARGLRRLRRGAGVHRLAPSRPSTRSPARRESTSVQPPPRRDARRLPAASTKAAEPRRPHHRHRRPASTATTRMTAASTTASSRSSPRAPAWARRASSSTWRSTSPARSSSRARATRTQRWEEPGYGVVVFSLEMPREQLANRMLCSEARVDVSKVRTGMLDAERLEQAHAGGVATSASLPDLDRRHAGARPSSSCAPRCGASRPSTTAADEATGEPKQRIGLVVVDYLQLMRGRDGANSREQEISEISRGLKQLAKELKLPVIALSPAQSRGRDAQREEQAAAALGPARVGRHRAGRRQHLLHLPRRLLQQGDGRPSERRGAHHRQAAQRPDRHGARSRFDAQYTRFDNLADGRVRGRGGRLTR